MSDPALKRSGDEALACGGINKRKENKLSSLTDELEESPNIKRTNNRHTDFVELLKQSKKLSDYTTPIDDNVQTAAPSACSSEYAPANTLRSH